MAGVLSVDTESNLAPVAYRQKEVSSCRPE